MRSGILRLALLWLLVAVQAFSQSYEETEAFILRKYSGTFGDSDLSITISVTFSEKCKATFSEVDNFLKLGRRSHIDKVIDFSLIDPTRIKWEPNSHRDSGIEISATEDKNSISYVYRETEGYPPGSTRTFSSTELVFSLDERVGHQLERAFGRLTKLCGGKSEIF